MIAELTGDQRAESIAAWLERMAEDLDARGGKDQRSSGHLIGVAALHRARASDIRAGLDLPTHASPLNPTR